MLKAVDDGLHECRADALSLQVGFDADFRDISDERIVTECPDHSDQFAGKRCGKCGEYICSAEKSIAKIHGGQIIARFAEMDAFI
ncbi:hypothetical protein WK43_01615 [Burkholderia ubonensis]|uniref:Uncharacterized protein n=1 Tax=Burkholderia ubonensis TaxID=101571 RepID=A0A107ERT0_9BURK|nr:hypothetical protein WK37_06520 [Burkholderia ubonensis]KVS52635.1 hypothetical protein WK38_10510 [Burkholderia ubonensis]KVS68558.1 hypothetical protein WK42_31120 [Burkholderia ubonensis]KVS83855.1 hypothetical protein WK43_01615 [Burkholderia ubonensis]KVS96113.1 hypothetical protein WK44_05490 [Burkholderia ubonensis]